MNRPADEQEQRLAQLKREASRREFDRHASVLQNVSELPAEFQTSHVTELAARETLDRIVVFPPQIRRGGDYVPKQALLFTPTGIIHLISSIWPGEEPQVTCIHACDLMFMDITLILLYGFLEIAAQGPVSPTRLGAEFNTVAWALLIKPLRRLLQADRVPANGALRSQVLPPAIEELPLKFANGVKLYGLLPGEQVQEIVFQPCTWKKWLHFLRRPLTANTLLLLTSNYLVLIREGLKVSQGWILTYFPRECIAGMQNQPGELYNELTIRLERGDQSAEYRLPLVGEAVEAWHAAWLRHNGAWKELEGPGEMSGSPHPD